MQRPPRLGPALQRLVGPDQLYRQPVRRLTPGQAETLTQVLRAPDRFDEAVSVPRAIAALAQGATPDVAVPVLARILDSRRADIPSKVIAASELASIATAGAERGLWRGIDDAAPRVRQEVLWALGAIGSPAALRRLAKLPTPADASTLRQLAFARALIAHRHGLPGSSLPPADGDLRRPEEVGDQGPMSAAQQTAAATAGAVRRLDGTRYGIALAARSLHIECGATWTIFLNRDLEPAAMAARLSERPWVLGLMARHYAERHRLSVAAVILATPEGDSVRVDVVRTDGERIFAGRAAVERAGVRFTVSDVDRPGTAPACVSGVITARGLEITQAAVSRRRVRVRQTIAAPGVRAADDQPGPRPAHKGV